MVHTVAMMMRRAVSALLPLVCLAAQAAAEPRIAAQGVKNAADYWPVTLRGRGLAPGMIFVIQGTGLGPEELVAAAPPYPLRLPETAGGTEVRIRTAQDGAEIRAPLVHSSARQVAAILPQDFPLGEAALTVTWQGETSEPFPLPVVDSNPGLFTVGQNGYGPGVIQNYESPGVTPLNGLTRPARPGQYIILWGTGLGSPADEVEAVIGSVPVRPSYAGPAPGYPGLDQYNIRLPDDGSLILGCYTPVGLRVGERFSGSALFATSEDGRACAHPWGLPEDRLAELDAGRTVNVARLRVLGPVTWIGTPQQPAFLAEFRAYNATEVATGGASAGVAAGVIGIFRPGQPGCGVGDGSIHSVRLGGDGGETPSLPPPSRTVLDAGETIQLAGPGGRHLFLHKSERFDWTGMYMPAGDHGAIAPGFFEGGEWTLAAPGGDDLGRFAVPITAPYPVRGEAPEVIIRSEGATVAWNAAQLGGGRMAITLYVPGESRPDPNTPGWTITEFDRLSCGADVSEGEFTIPAEALNQLPPSEKATLSIGLWTPEGYTVRFEIPGVDYATFTQSSGYSRTVRLQ